MTSICFYCGSQSGNDDSYTKGVKEFITALAKKGYTFVYGGGNKGMMGVAANQALECKAHIIGITTRHLKNLEVAHTELSELIVADDMHQRKLLMEQHSDVFVALPGGIGTLEEIFEQWTWHQIGIHSKPCVLFNINGFFDMLISFLEKISYKGFMNKSFFESLIISSDPDEIICKIKNFSSPISKWDSN